MVGRWHVLFQVLPIFHRGDFRSFVAGRVDLAKPRLGRCCGSSPKNCWRRFHRSWRQVTQGQFGTVGWGTGIVNMKSNIYDIIWLYIVVIVNVIYISSNVIVILLNQPCYANPVITRSLSKNLQQWKATVGIRRLLTLRDHAATTFWRSI